MKLSTQSQTAIQASLREAMGRFTTEGEEQTVITDIHLQPKQDTGELIIFNDDEEVLSRTVVEEWVEYENDDFYTVAERVLRNAVTTLREQGALEKTKLMKPYSFVLVDDEKETVAELLLVDDEDTLLLNEELLKGLDEELDAFLKDLLEK